MKKLSTALLLICVLTTNVFAAGEKTPPVVIDEFQGLYSNPAPDRIPNGAHSRFTNVYVNDGNIQNVKGRDRLNSTALTNTTTNGFWYYENAAGSTKKLVRFENTVLASYDVDGTNRTELNTGLTSEKHDAKQIGDTLYITSDTDGLYKWTGSGAATAISGVAAPSNVDFSGTTGDGGLTPGLPIAVTPSLVTDETCATSPSATATGCLCLSATDCDDEDTGGSGVTSDVGTLEQAGTSTTYGYKVTKYSSIWGIESEASSSDSASLTGDTTFTWAATNCQSCDGTGATYDTYVDACCTGVDYVTTGRQTRTTGTLASAPSAPFDGYRVYRTVAGGSDYFLLGYQTTGAYTDGKADVSLGTPLDTTIDTITPPSYRYLEEYKGLVFIAQDTNIYFNHLPVNAVTSADTYWIESDKLTTGSNTPITGLHTTSNSLLIFTSSRVLELTGFGISSFRLKTLVENVGAVSDETIETDTNGNVIFSAGVQGVYMLSAGQAGQDSLTGAVLDSTPSSLVRISSPALDNVFSGQDDDIVITASDYTTSHAYFDRDNDLYFLYVGQHCFIYNTANKSWSYIPATRMTGSVYRKSPNGTGRGVLMDNLGFMYSNWVGYENGIESGSVTGTITSSGATTLTCSGCTFNTTNDGLKGLWVFLDNENDEWRQISSNTGTQITVSSAWTTNPIAADNFYIAYIIPDWETKQILLDKPPKDSTITSFWVIHNKAVAAQDLHWYAFQNKETTEIIANNFDLNDDFDLGNKIVHKMSTPIRGWAQWRFRTFIYNTSDSINPPVDILSYAMRGEVIEER